MFPTWTKSTSSGSLDHVTPVELPFQNQNPVVHTCGALDKDTAHPARASDAIGTKANKARMFLQSTYQNNLR
jgi:hypothetical protein